MMSSVVKNDDFRGSCSQHLPLHAVAALWPGSYAKLLARGPREKGLASDVVAFHTHDWSAAPTPRIQYLEDPQELLQRWHPHHGRHD